MTEPADLGPTGGVVWSNPHEWARRRSPDGCVICVSGAPLDVAAELESCWATIPRQAPLPAYVCVVAREHVNEPFEMPPEVQAEFWRDTMVIARAVADYARPIKMNYEIHGNTVPHLHVHLFPRHNDDPFVGGPIDPRAVALQRTDDEISDLAQAIRASAQPGS